MRHLGHTLKRQNAPTSLFYDVYADQSRVSVAGLVGLGHGPENGSDNQSPGHQDDQSSLLRAFLHVQMLRPDGWKV